MTNIPTDDQKIAKQARKELSHRGIKRLGLVRVTNDLLASLALTCCALGMMSSPAAVAKSHGPKKNPVHESSKPIYLNPQYSFRERAADLVSRMTLGEEVKQLHTNSAPAIPRLGVQEYTYWSEGQHGVNRINDSNGVVNDVHATSFPTNFASTMSWDPQLIYRETTAISDEARGFLDKSLWGKHQNNLGSSRKNYGFLTYWAPTINMDRDPRWGRTDEAFGEDPYLASQMAGAFVDGYQGQTLDGKAKTGYLKVAATAKHYALNNVENNRTGISSNARDGAIRDYYTATFRNLIEQAHVAGLMTSYNAINGTPAVADTYTANELAQRTYGFHGYITSDCGAVGTTYKSFPKNLHSFGGHDWAPPGWKINHQGKNATWTNKKTGKSVSGAAGGQAYAERAGTALNCTGDEATLSNIKEAIKAGILSKGVIDRNLTRVFAIRMATGEFDPRGQVPYTRITKSAIQSHAHQRLAEKVAENSLVLLKNDPIPGLEKRLLPLDASKLHKVVILGDLANKTTLGGYSGDPSLQVNAVQGITSAVKAANSSASVIFDAANTSTTTKSAASLSSKTKADIKSAELVIVFVGTDENIAKEGHDRASLAMPGNYDSLIKQVAALGNHKMALIIQSDGPVKINDVQSKFPAIVFSGYNGESQGRALARVLLGQKNPSGHLDFTWFKDDSQLPHKSNYDLTPSRTGGLGRTYQYFTGKPTYPFGYGLSYTRFKYTHIKISSKHVSPNGIIKARFDVTNTGSVPGATVAQLYVATPVKITGQELPIKRLEGFQKTKTLTPGQTQHVSLAVKVSNLARWNENNLRRVVYNGPFRFQIGASSRDIAASRTVKVQGKLTPKIARVTVQPKRLIYNVGETLNLNGKNKWIKSDINPSLEQPHATADNIIEAVNNNGSFVDLAHAHVRYHSSNDSVASVNKNGVVKASGRGVAKIKATVNGVSGSAVIVVKQPSIADHHR